MGRRRWLGWVLPAVLLSVVPKPLFAEPREVFFRQLPIEDPSGHALDNFFAALRRTAQPKSRNVTRIAHYGDSFIVNDNITKTLRGLYQQRYGDAGPGYLLAGRPWDWYRHHGVRVSASGGWQASRVNGGSALADGLFGYGGVSFLARKARRQIWLSTNRTEFGLVRLSAIDVHYLVQPRGGDIELTVDGEHVMTIATEGETPRSAFHRLEIADGRHDIVLRTAGGPVRLFGVALERRGPGVVYDSLGLSGACTTALGQIEADHLTRQFAHRRPDLVVLAFGANETNRPAFVSGYVERVAPVVRRVRRAARNASCLIVAPLDRGRRSGGGRVVSDERIAAIVAGQREVALSEGCAFFNTYEAMGGSQGMNLWSRNGLASFDLVHPTPEGAETIGQGLFQALESAFEGSL